MRCKECAVRTTPEAGGEAGRTALDRPMAIFGLAWLVLMVVDLVRGLGRVR